MVSNDHLFPRYMKIIPYSQFYALAMDEWDTFFAPIMSIPYQPTEWWKEARDEFLIDWYYHTKNEILTCGYKIFTNEFECLCYCEKNSLFFDGFADISETSLITRTKKQRIGDQYCGGQNWIMFWMICDTSEQYNKFTFLLTVIIPD